MVVTSAPRSVPDRASAESRRRAPERSSTPATSWRGAWLAGTTCVSYLDLPVRRRVDARPSRSRAPRARRRFAARRAGGGGGGNRKTHRSLRVTDVVRRRHTVVLRSPTAVGLKDG